MGDPCGAESPVSTYFNLKKGLRLPMICKLGRWKPASEVAWRRTRSRLGTRRAFRRRSVIGSRGHYDYG